MKGFSRMKHLYILLFILIFVVLSCFSVFAEEDLSESTTEFPTSTTAAVTTEAPTTAAETTTPITTVEETTEVISETTIPDDTAQATINDLSLRLEYIQAVLTIALIGGIFMFIMFLFYKVFDIFISR